MSDLINLVDVLQQKRLLWQGREQPSSPILASSGYAVFDEKLAGGFPETGVVSIESQVGIGELRFLSSRILKEQSKNNDTRLLVFINPPGVLCAEFFHHQNFDVSKILLIQPKQKNDALWAAEQCLKSGACDAVLLWQNQFEVHQIKRLQLACEEGKSLQFLMQTKAQSGLSLPVSLSMCLTASPQGLNVRINKRKGAWDLPAFTLNMSQYWPTFSLTQQKPASNVIRFPQTQHRQGL